MQSPFLGPQQFEVPPSPVVKPLVYCEFRTTENVEYGTPDVSMCGVFATEIIHEMAFCYQNGQVIQAGLAKETGNGG